MVDAPEDDAEVRARLAGVRPELDSIVRSVMQANARAALFGTRPTIEVGRYQLLREVGTGGGGSVFVARDPELDREIAIKLIVAASDELRTRAFSEGQALARLSHPNIVPVFDVGVRDERVYLVMELVRGESLRRYAERATVRQIVSAYRQAGEGLAAAHEAGLVHRDFKPDNAVIGADGRVRVIDFGLARPATDDAPRGIAGTPRYMAPEQRTGQSATPASDQYAFAVSLREAVGEPLPRWLDAVVRRGANDDPAARFPDMPALLRALANDPRRRWGRRALLGGMAAIGMAAFFVGRAQTTSAITCPDAHVELAPVWNPATRSALAVHLDALPSAYARQVRPHLIEALDAYGDHWVQAHQSACSARKRGAQSDALFDRRIACLARARAALASAVHVVRDATAGQLAQAATSVGELPGLELCSNPAALEAGVDPVPIAKAAAVAQLDRELAALEVQVRAGQANRPEVRETAVQLVERARLLGYRPVLARALRVVGVGALALERRGAAIAPLEEAMTLAFAAGFNELGVELYARSAWAQGMVHDPERALAGLAIVEAVASRLPDAARSTRALLANNVGSIELAAGHRERARERFEQSLRELADSPATVELAQIPANLALVIDDPTRRAKLFGETIEQLTAKLGVDHPLTLDARIRSALSNDDRGASERDLTSACTAYREFHPTHGAQLARCAYELAQLAHDRADVHTARAWFSTAVAAGAHDDDKTLLDLARAHVMRLDGDATAARAAFMRIRAEIPVEAPWWRQMQRAEAEFGVGLSAHDCGDLAGARASLERAATTQEQVLSLAPTASRRRALERMTRALSLL